MGGEITLNSALGNEGTDDHDRLPMEKTSAPFQRSSSRR
jgi:hypothetical protein